MRKQAISNLSQRFSDNYSSYVYISRSDADSRRVINEEELLDELKQMGFEPYTLSELDFEEQVRLFLSSRYNLRATWGRIFQYDVFRRHNYNRTFQIG